MGDRPPESPDDIDYELPARAIAQVPAAHRDEARLLVDAGEAVAHRRVAELPELLSAGDLVVVNDTRVLPARLPMRRGTGGAVEVLLLEERTDGAWEALVRPSSRIRPGERLTAGPLTAEVLDDLGEGRRLVRLDPGGRRLLDVLDEVGLPPLPPYIHVPVADPERYQTVFARRPGSAAAPTAGLHLTDPLLAGLVARGASVANLELVVGLDTFRPVSADRLDDHLMHTERYRIPPSTLEAVETARRVVAIGTTTVRALETWALTGEPEGRTGLFIRRPFDWRLVDVMMTNFHLPRSTLLCMIDAFVGPRWRDLYAEALASGYRFLSFGDAMLLTRRIS
ncbi:MAG: tRNA preQ1(34) S-adenosylmethionine ribosyltransferase-isomerase QueA [Acidimicrobiales bacterium]